MVGRTAAAGLPASSGVSGCADNATASLERISGVAATKAVAGTGPPSMPVESESLGVGVVAAPEISQYLVSDFHVLGIEKRLTGDFLSFAPFSKVVQMFSGTARQENEALLKRNLPLLVIIEKLNHPAECINIILFRLRYLHSVIEVVGLDKIFRMVSDTSPGC